MTALYFDIETIGNPDAVALLGPVKADSRLKDPAKIAADLADKDAKRFERAALDCDTLRIVCLGYARSTDDGPRVLTGDEATILRDWWEVVDHTRNEYANVALVGFNILGFDLPALVRRSQILGVPMPPLALAKYRHEGIVDLMDVLTWGGLVDAKPLSTYCRLFGVQTVAAEDEVSGADVARLWAEGNVDAIVAHCAADVWKTRALDERVFGLRGGAR